ncbi:MAG: PDZ domain-containing protein [Verrucomicrobiota bacterium]
MKPSLRLLLGLACLQGMAAAQDDIPLLRPEERQAVDAQTGEFNQALAPVLTTAAKSTVRVWAGDQRLAYGTVVGDGHKILTKWSEVARGRADLRIESSDGKVLAAKIAGVYEDEDLAVLETSGPPFTPVQWSKENLQLGAFLAAPQPDGRPAAFGVVSVLERNLRDTDHAYLGIMGVMDFTGPGVKIQDVATDSGAATAGLHAGQIILKVGERPISGMMELKNALVGVNPGTTVTLLVQTERGPQKFAVQLGNRPQLPNYLGDRLRQMERMGGPISLVRDSFSRVIQTDMRPQPDQIGGPVVDLNGRIVGITLARADRTRAFVMPAAAVETLLKSSPKPPAVAQLRQNEDASAIPVRERAQPGRPPAVDEELLRRHLSGMRQLMDHLREEMEALEQER